MTINVKSGGVTYKASFFKDNIAGLLNSGIVKSFYDFRYCNTNASINFDSAFEHNDTPTVEEVQEETTEETPQGTNENHDSKEDPLFPGGKDAPFKGDIENIVEHYDNQYGDLFTEKDFAQLVNFRGFPKDFVLGKELQHPIFIKAIQKVLQELQDAIPNFSNEDAKKFFDSIYAKAGMHSSVRKAIGDILTQMAQDLSESIEGVDPTARGYKQLKKMFKKLVTATTIKEKSEAIAFIETTAYRGGQLTEKQKKLLDKAKKELEKAGYEYVPMLGKDYHEGMKVTANFIEDPNLPVGARIISSVITPMLIKDGVMVQSAQIIVKQNLDGREGDFELSDSLYAPKSKKIIDIQSKVKELLDQGLYDKTITGGKLTVKYIENRSVVPFSPLAVAEKKDSDYPAASSISDIINNIKDYIVPQPVFTSIYNTFIDNSLTSYAEGAINHYLMVDNGGRPTIILRINGMNIPFYMSTGLGGKKDVATGKFYPFFGVGADNWINKLSGTEINNYYGSEALKVISEALDAEFGNNKYTYPDSNPNNPNGVSTSRIVNGKTETKMPDGKNQILAPTIRDIINRDITPTENGNKDTKQKVQENIDKVSSHLSQLPLNSTTQEFSNQELLSQMIGLLEASDIKVNFLEEMKRFLENNGNKDIQLGINLNGYEYNVLAGNLFKNFNNETNLSCVGITANNWYVCNYYSGNYFTVLGKLPINGNEDIIKILEKEIKNEPIRSTEDFNRRVKNIKATQRKYNNGMSNVENGGQNNRDVGLVSNEFREEQSSNTSRSDGQGNEIGGTGWIKVPWNDGTNGNRWMPIPSDSEKFMTPQGEIYAFVDKKGDMYIDETKISPEHLVHEYTHLWDRAVQKRNPELWNKGVKLMKQLPLWQEIANSENYGKEWIKQGKSGTELENLIASEVHARIVGVKGNELLQQVAKQKGTFSISQMSRSKTCFDYAMARKRTFEKRTFFDYQPPHTTSPPRVQIKIFGGHALFNARMFRACNKLKSLRAKPCFSR